MKPPFGVDALWQIKRIGSPTLSPDGAMACAAVTRFDMESNESTTELWLFPTQVKRTGASRFDPKSHAAAYAPPHGRPKAARASAYSSGPSPRRLTSGDKDSEPRWSPDGRLIAFVAKRSGDDEPQLYVIAPDGGEARRLTKIATGCACLKWFPDSKRIAFVSAVWPDLRSDAAQAKRKAELKKSKVKVHATERAEYRYWDHWLTDGREPHIMVCDVASGRCRDALQGTGLALPPWEPHSEDFDISPNGREIALTVDRGSEPQMMAQTDIVVHDLATRRTRVLTEESGLSDAQPVYAPDGSAIVWRSFDTDRAFNDQGHLTHYDRRTRRATHLAPRFDRASSRVQWTPDSRSLLFLSEDRGRQGLWQLAIGVDSAQPQLLVGGGAIGGFAQGGDMLAFDRATAMHPPGLFACRADGSEERSIERLNDALLARHALADVREITIKGYDKDPVQVWVAYPPGFDARRKWPLLHSIHGGPHAAHLDSWHFRWNLHVLASRGYVVAAVNYHGSSGFGQRWMESITGRYGVKEYADTEAATDYLLRQGYIDRNRLLAAGGSYGGYMVAYMNGHTDRYRAYICHAGCYDWVSMMATDGYKFFADELGAFHWDDPARVMRQSPHHYVKTARTPTLVIHGEQDFRVPATQALQYYDTLKAKGVPARLLWFTDENHWIQKPQNARLWHREFFAWLERYGAAERNGRTGSAKRPRKRRSTR